MRYDREFGPRYGGTFEAPYPRHGSGRGFPGGSMPGRGWYGGGRRSGNEYDAVDDYDFDDGYSTGRGDRGSELSPPGFRGGYAWGESESAEDYGPARYGYGPYFDRLRRRVRPDDEIRHEVEETLFFDTWVDADAISVSVSGGIVTLQGTLPSYDELRFAVDDAWDVEGVRGVRSALDVDEGRRGRYGRGQRQASGPGQREMMAPGSDEWSRHLHGHPHAGEVQQGRSERADAPRDQHPGGGSQGARRGAGERAEQAGGDKPPRGRNPSASPRAAAPAGENAAGPRGAANSESAGSGRSRRPRAASGRPDEVAATGRTRNRGAARANQVKSTDPMAAGAAQEAADPGSSREQEE